MNIKKHLIVSLRALEHAVLEDEGVLEDAEVRATDPQDVELGLCGYLIEFGALDDELHVRIVGREVASVTYRLWDNPTSVPVPPSSPLWDAVAALVQADRYVAEAAAPQGAHCIFEGRWCRLGMAAHGGFICGAKTDAQMICRR